jgi:hypothetical protein
MLDIQFDASTTTIKTADLTYEGYGTKSSDLCGILGFVDDQGHIHLSSNFDVYTMRPKLTDFNLTSEKNSNHEDNRELILMKNLVQKKNVVQYIQKNVIQ